MKNMNEVPKGLKCKYVFLENDFPIFFSCIDEDDNDYLGCFSAVEDNYLKFTISKVSPLTILKVLKNEMSLYDAFKNSQYYYIYTLKENTEVEILNQVEDKYLPVKGEYLDAEAGEFEEEADAYLFKCSRQ